MKYIILQYFINSVITLGDCEILPYDIWIFHLEINSGNIQSFTIWTPRKCWWLNLHTSSIKNAFIDLEVCSLQLHTRGFWPKTGMNWITYLAAYIMEENMHADGLLLAHSHFCYNWWIRGAPVMHYCSPSVPLILSSQCHLFMHCVNYFSHCIA